MIDEVCRAIVARLDVKTFVETGTFQGETVSLVAQWFANLWPDEFGSIATLELVAARAVNPWNGPIAYPVFGAPGRGGRRIVSIEVDKDRAAVARKMFAGSPHVHVETGSSEAVLARMVQLTLPRPFFYLDAHWGAYWPIRDEIAQVIKLDQWAIVIDDFEVPGRPEFGFDIYQGRPLNWEAVRDLFPAGVARYYPLRSNRDNRGWILLAHGYDIATAVEGLPLRRCA